MTMILERTGEMEKGESEVGGGMGSTSKEGPSIGWELGT
jgi:hypothetical protein